MRATYRNGRKGNHGVYNANHNTLEKTRRQERHIEHDKTSENLCYAFDLSGKVVARGDFDAKKHEVAMYEELYGEELAAKNERYRKKGHKESIKTMRQIYESERTTPQEMLLQIGKGKEADPNILTEIAIQLVRELKQKGGYVPLDIALHKDEGAWHMHIRGTYFAKDKDGYIIPSQTKALVAMGYERPDPTQPQNKYNNPLISFTQAMRTRFYDLCEEHGYKIEREPESPGRAHIDIETYRNQTKIKELNEQWQQAEERASVSEARAAASEARAAAAEAEMQEIKKALEEAEAKKEEVEYKLQKESELHDKILGKNGKPVREGLFRKSDQVVYDLETYHKNVSIAEEVKKLIRSVITTPKEIEEAKRTIEDYNQRVRELVRREKELRDRERVVDQEIDKKVSERLTEVLRGWKSGFDALIERLSRYEPENIKMLQENYNPEVRAAYEAREKAREESERQESTRTHRMR